MLFLGLENKWIQEKSTRNGYKRLRSNSGEEEEGNYQWICNDFDNKSMEIKGDLTIGVSNQHCFSSTKFNYKMFFSFSFILSCIRNSRIKRTLKTSVDLIKLQDMTDGARMPINTTLDVCWDMQRDFPHRLSSVPVNQLRKSLQKDFVVC